MHHPIGHLAIIQVDRPCVVATTKVWTSLHGVKFSTDHSTHCSIEGCRVAE